LKFREKMFEAFGKTSKAAKRLPTAALVLLVLLAMFSNLHFVHAEPYRKLGYLRITEDTFTEQLYPTARHGSDATLSAIFNETRPEGNYTSIIFLKIDASPLIHQYAYVSVRLAAYLCCVPDLHWWPYIGLYLNPDFSWDEDTLDWAHMPILTNDLIWYDYIETYPPCQYNWCYFELTYGIRRAMLAGNTMVTLVIACVSDMTYSGEVQMKSTDAEQSLRPRVEIEAAECFPIENEGDINGDAHVNIGDVALVTANWQKTFPYINPPEADLNQDGIVNIGDASLVAENWAKTYDNTPIAYSSDIRFEIPADGDDEIWYTVMIRMYLPSSYQHVWFRATWVDFVSPYSAMIIGGSQWKDPAHPGYSERDFEAKARFGIYVNRTFYEYYPDGPTFNRHVNATFEISVGNREAGWVLLPSVTNDIGVTLNMTVLSFDSDIPEDPTGNLYWCLTLNNVTMDVCSFEWLKLSGIEYYDEGESVVNPDWTIAIDYFGSLIMTSSTLLAPIIPGGTTTAAIGNIVGLATKGAVAAYRYIPQQQLAPFTETISELHHRQLQYNQGPPMFYLGPLTVWVSDQNKTDNDIFFLSIGEPESSMRCGMTCVTLRGEMQALWYSKGAPHPELLMQLGELEISLCIPWFLRR
jgi:hypothetical protein